MKRGIELFLVCTLLLTACGDDPVPKPRGYLRLDLPEQKYVPWTNGEGLSAEVPAYARMHPRRSGESETRWYDMRFPGQRATVHLTWSPVNGQMAELIEDAHMFKNTHGAKAAK